MVLFLSIGLLLITPTLAVGNCFLAKENNQVIEKEGDCESRHSPCSTFKIAISLMGYNEGLLIDEMHPELPFNLGYDDWLDNWKQPHTPRLWMKHSCVWYSRVLTHKLGMRKFKEYVTQFNYGNQDVSGDKGQDNGLIRSWISSSLEISPEEQTVFLQKLLDNKLSVSLKAHAMARNILFVEDFPNGWKLYGKTGMGYMLSEDRTQKLDHQMGWFIGWIQKDNRTIVFVQYVEDDDKQDTYASLRAKAKAKERLTRIVQDLPMILDIGEDDVHLF